MRQLEVAQIQQIETDMLREIVSIFQKHSIPYFALYGTALGALRHGGSIPWDIDIDLGIPYSYLLYSCNVLRKELPPNYTLLNYDVDPKYVLLFPRVAVSGYSYSHLHVDLFPIIGTDDKVQDRSKHTKVFEKMFYQYGVKKHKRVYAKTYLRRAIKKLLQEICQLTCISTANTIIRKYESFCNAFPYNESEYLYVLCPCYGTKNFIPKSWFGEGKIIQYEGIPLNVPERIEEYLKHYYADYLQFPNKEVQKKGLKTILEVPDDFVLFKD